MRLVVYNLPQAPMVQFGDAMSPSGVVEALKVEVKFSNMDSWHQGGQGMMELDVWSPPYPQTGRVPMAILGGTVALDLYFTYEARQAPVLSSLVPPMADLAAPSTFMVCRSPSLAFFVSLYPCLPVHCLCSIHGSALGLSLLGCLVCIVLCIVLCFVHLLP